MRVNIPEHVRCYTVLHGTKIPDVQMNRLSESVFGIVIGVRCPNSRMYRGSSSGC